MPLQLSKNFINWIAAEDEFDLMMLLPWNMTVTQTNDGWMLRSEGEDYFFDDWNRLRAVAYGIANRPPTPTQ